jgi:hypothetical protein
MEQNKVHRLLVCAAQVNPATIALREPKHFDLNDPVHVDEKWLWLCQGGEKYILVDEGSPPHCEAQELHREGRVPL